MIRRSLSVLITALLFVSCASDDRRPEENNPAAHTSSISGQIGGMPVGVIPVGVLHDDVRNKDLQFAVDYPIKSGAAYPLVIFSPGYGGSHRGYVGLSSYWASQGYVVVRLSHADAGRLRQGANAEDIWEQERPPQWRDRVRDVTFVIDSLDALEKQFPELAGKIDRARIGVGGHSYGAFTAMLVGGARTFPGPVSYADKRVKAIIAMSPQGTGDVRGLTQESWSELTVPTLFMTGTADRGFLDSEPPEWRREAFQYAPAGDKWLVVLEGVGHWAFAGRMDAPVDRPSEPIVRNPNTMDPRPVPQTEDPRRPGREGQAGLRQRGAMNTIKAISLAFWDAYLKGEAEGKTILEGASSRGGVELLKK